MPPGSCQTWVHLPLMGFSLLFLRLAGCSLGFRSSCFIASKAHHLHCALWLGSLWSFSLTWRNFYSTLWTVFRNLKVPTTQLLLVSHNAKEQQEAEDKKPQTTLGSPVCPLPWELSPVEATSTTSALCDRSLCPLESVLTFIFILGHNVKGLPHKHKIRQLYTLRGSVQEKAQDISKANLSTSLVNLCFKLGH